MLLPLPSVVMVMTKEHVKEKLLSIEQLSSSLLLPGEICLIYILRN